VQRAGVRHVSVLTADRTAAMLTYLMSQRCADVELLQVHFCDSTAVAVAL